MTIEHQSIEFGSTRIAFTVSRRKRSTLEIAVEPDASVVVAAPLDATPEDIAAKVRKRAAWVQRQQRFFEQYLPRTPERRYVAGETHRYLGRQYRLKVVFGQEQKVQRIPGFLVVYSRRPDASDTTKTLLEQWYRDRARVKFIERLEVNLARFPDSEAFRPRGIVIRQLRKRWGSMSPGMRLLLNRRLIEAPLDAIDYVITHELCHIAEPHHGPAFFALLDEVLPDWPKRKERLEQCMA